MKTKMNLTAVFEEADEGGFIAFIEEIPGVNTQGDILDEARGNLMDALKMVTEAHRENSEKKL